MKTKLKGLRIIALLIICTVLFSVSSFASGCTHSSLGELYSEAEHPHAYFRYCNICGEKVYTGGYETKQHGDGSWGSGTCPDCGEHTFIVRPGISQHPHITREVCFYCGEEGDVTYYVDSTCGHCKMGMETVSATEETNVAIIWFSDIYPVSTVGEMTVSVSVSYNFEDQSIFAQKFDDRFASFSANVSASFYTNQTESPDIYVMAGENIDYYMNPSQNEDDTPFSVQSLTRNAYYTNTAVFSGAFVIYEGMPSHAIANAGLMVLGIVVPEKSYVHLYF